jgi:hypothetical protein
MQLLNLQRNSDKIERYQQIGQLHYITFTCSHRLKHLDSASVRDVFEPTLARVRRLTPSRPLRSVR